MKNIFFLLLFFTASAAMLSCSGGASKKNPVPLPMAYPRIADIDTSYIYLDSLPVQMVINTSSLHSVSSHNDSIVWCTVSYPELKANVLYTFTAVDTANLVDNIDRIHYRIRRDLGNVQPEFLSFDNPSGYTVQVLYTPSILPTPVHFLAVDPDNPRWLVSGAAFFPSLPENASLDSLLPAANILHREITRSLSSLK